MVPDWFSQTDVNIQRSKCEDLRSVLVHESNNTVKIYKLLSICRSNPEDLQTEIVSSGFQDDISYICLN